MNLPAGAEVVEPRYQDIEARDVALLSSHDGASLVRVIAGEVDGHRGPGVTYTPIAYPHATVAPGSQLELPWPRDFNALVYVLAGRGYAGRDEKPLDEGQLAVFGPGDALSVRAAEQQPVASKGGWEILDPRRPADPRAGRALRPLRDEHARGDRAGGRGLQRRQDGHHPRDARPAPHVARTRDWRVR